MLVTIERIIEGLADAWNRRDSQAWADHFSEDADFVDVVARLQRGRAEIEASARKILDTIYCNSHLKMWELDRRPLSEDTTLLHTATALDVADGPRQGHYDSVQTLVVREGRILAFQNTMSADWAP
ncbi:SgcJ/EcaC family oxidoreductase [Nocardia sp. CDC159]|uniref:SgcJ/EcaC family oxidoreductase n=1 Tax=Nocardia pulmonis TaxID=2951408 RepID=A0A9X2IY50_9NOCA|nr:MULTISPECIES: SgcJ/EcaC family oxidoreductase [Nocardia]MCM6776692.1 SgcJ/EcaC family oxidoreductase [Nocardia pulmonis]MCM6789159.1 SgcJ/EcaC family oxidoreductase [Nocardia sp. CDC159]